MSGRLDEARRADWEREGRAQLLEYWRVLSQGRWVVLATLATVVAAALFATLFTTPIYEASTTLQIDRRGPDILTFQDVVGVDPSYAAYQDFYQTQYRILQSRAVARIAAERLDLVNHPAFVRRTSDSDNSANDAGTRADRAIAFVRRGAEITPVRNSQLVQIAFRDPDPALATDVANAIAEAYLNFSFRARYDTTAVASEFLTKEVARIQTDISELEGRLQGYGRDKNLVSVRADDQDVSQQALATLNTRSAEARGRLAAAEARWQAARDAHSDSLDEVLASPLIRTLREEHAELERRYGETSERFKDDWPAVRELRNAMAVAEARIEAETATIARQVRESALSDLARARTEVERLDAQVAAQRGEVQRVARDAIEFESLSAEIDTKRRVLADLVARESETQVTDRMQDTRASNVRIVDRAEIPERPVRPRPLLNLMVALAVGALLGAALAFGLDHLDNTIKAPEDIARITPLPVLAAVPRFRRLRAIEGHDREPAEGIEPDLASHEDSRSAFSEAFRALRTAILLASPEHPPRTIVITSVLPQDGKSTVGVNLATVLTQLGHRVLLIDADLRKPRLHRVFGIEPDIGLSALLSGLSDPDGAVSKTCVSGLDVLTSGPIPPNPSELLGSPRLAALVEQLRAAGPYDHVVVDSPPVASVADPLILAAVADATVLVVRAGRTPREALRVTVERLERARGRTIGVVLNDVESGHSAYYSTYRYYSESSESPGRRKGTRRTAGRAS